MKIILRLLLIFAVFLLFGGLFPMLLAWIEENVPIISYAFIAVSALTLISMFGIPLVKLVWGSSCDWVLLRSTRALPTNRAQIARVVTGFHTDRGRSAYVRWLWIHAAELDADVRDPGDQWPAKSRPNFGNDGASDLLARLDERWLGLAR
jgi:hypothetical protein